MFAFVVDNVWILLVLFFVMPMFGLSFEETAGFDMSSLPSDPAAFEAYLFSIDSPFLQPQYILGNFGFPMAIIIACWLIASTTPGKRVLGMKIVDAKTGGKVSFFQCLVRYLGYFVCIITGGLGFLWILIDRRKQGWQDKLAGTLVVYIKSETETSQTDT